MINRSLRRQRAINYLLKHPDASASAVAKASGLTTGTVYKLIRQRQTPVETLMSPPPTSEGRKDDSDKTPWHLMPPDALNQIAQVLEFGANKYGDRNWEKGMHWSRPFSALMRHMWAWWRGENRDPETGLSHLAHAGCCILFLLSYEGRAHGTDDRPYGSE
jgi:hypothetical protein